ncbi:MAG: peptidoglycan DD-metalloendopeptidase family protein [Clostridia bacterium]|nr:peptidoglycan DD-metalloendopeptidase family protein [Clostridia bacterium]
MKSGLRGSALPRAILAVCIMCTVMLGLSADFTTASSSPSDLSSKENALGNLNDQIEKTRGVVTKYKKEEKNALAALQKVEARLEDLQDSIANTDARLKNAEKQLVKAEADLAVAEKALTAATDDYQASVARLGGRLTEIYKLGPGTYLELLLNAEDFSDFVTRYEFLGMIIQQDSGVLSRVKEERDQIEERKASIAKRQESLEEKKKEIALLSASLKREEKSAQEAMSDRAYYLKRVQAEKGKWERELAEEERQSRELERTIRDMQAKLSASGRAPVWRGKFVWPTLGRISSEFGWRVHPVFKDRRFHSGIDIAARTGTRVAAAASGTVLLAGWINGYGNTVIIAHGDGLSTLYGHNSALTTSSGKTVLQGDTISKVGSTGFATGPHLHFEVRLNGKPKNPLDWLPAR